MVTHVHLKGQLGCPEAASVVGRKVYYDQQCLPRVQEGTVVAEMSYIFPL